MKEIAYLRNQLKFNLPPSDHPSAAVPRESWRELKETLPWSRLTWNSWTLSESALPGPLAFLSEL